MIKTDDRLYPNKTNLPDDLKYSTERVFSDINNKNKWKMNTRFNEFFLN